MVQIIINPGTETVQEPIEFSAGFNLAVFLERSLLKNITVKRQPDEDYNGFYTSLITLDTNDPQFDLHRIDDRSIAISMPGVALNEVMYLGIEGQNVWHYKRIYIDHSSWIWTIGMDIVNEWYVDGTEVYDDE